MNIYVKFPIPKTLEEFLLLLFGKFDREDNGEPYEASGVETFFDKECTKRQCRPGARRSIEDTFDCVKTYYPKTDLETLVRALIKIRPEGLWFCPTFCSDINKSVIHYELDKESGRLYSSGGKWSWKSVLEPLGITDFKELYQ